MTDTPKDAGFASLVGKQAVVTGSSRGIGRAIAMQLAAAGADVLIHGGTNRKAAEDTAGAIQKTGRRSGVLVQDLGDASQYDTFVDRAFAWAGGMVQIWVNNAGVDVLTGSGAALSFEEKLERLWQVDVRATVGLGRRVGRKMREASDSGDHVILNIGWDRAELGLGGDSGEMFAVSKGAITAFTRSLAKSLAPDVRVNCLAPGWIRTAWGNAAPEYWQKRAVRESLRDRWGVPADVARAALFLASPQADFITGQVIAINGGFRDVDIGTSDLGC